MLSKRFLKTAQNIDKYFEKLDNKDVPFSENRLCQLFELKCLTVRQKKTCFAYAEVITMKKYINSNERKPYTTAAYN